jgi:peroxiredoxin
LRQDYAQFAAMGTEIVAIGPDGPNAFRRYWSENSIPFPGYPDIGARVSARYYQEVSLFKLGRMPAIFVIDRLGRVRYAHYGDSMADIPPNSEVLAILAQLQSEEQPAAAGLTPPQADQR